MQSRMPIVVAAIAGLAAVLLMQLYVSDLRASFEPEKRVVAVSSRELRAGALLAAEDLSPATKVRDSLPKLYIDWAQRGNFVGQRLVSDVVEGDYVLQTYFGTGTQALARASEKIDPRGNDRLMTIPVAAETALEGAIRPGDRLDVLLTYQAAPADLKPGQTQQVVNYATVPLIENLYVLYTGPFGSNPRQPYSSITVLVSPDQGKLITWALALGKLGVLLRNPKNLQPGDRTFIFGDVNTLQQLGGQKVNLGQIAGQAAPSPEEAPK